MKKFLLSLLAVCTLGFLPAVADDYQEKLVVTINGNSTDSIPANITVSHEADGTITFSLKNFTMGLGDDQMPVGNITLGKVAVEQKEGYEAISTTQTIQIEAGDDPNVVEEEWMGPMLGDVPIVMNGKLKADKLFVNIDIDMSETPLAQVINVAVGQDKGFDPVLPEVTIDSTASYAENLVVTINGNSTDSIPAKITVDHMSDGTITFSLKNFTMGLGDDQMPVGNITLSKVAVEQKEGYEAISTTQTIQIEAGDDPNVAEEEWMGPMLGDVPIVMSGKLKADKLFVNIDIDMSETPLGQVINVAVGQDKGFEPVPDGINQVNADSVRATGVYTLGGVRVADTLTNALPKGVYVVNGKKIVK